MSSVKVAVRVRPFLDREKGSKCCISMVSESLFCLCIAILIPSYCLFSQKGKTTAIFDPNTGDDRPFTFDYSFWSHDGFETTDEGVYVPTNEKYADQNIVFNALGKQVLDNAWEGFNTCLFAYGQTGSGKSYSMVIKQNLILINIILRQIISILTLLTLQIGYGPNIGIVPITCNEIFSRIGNQRDDTHRFEVNFSMLEIYNERV